VADSAEKVGQSERQLCPYTSDVNLFRYRKSVIDFYGEISNGALDLREQELHCPQIAGAPINQGRLGSPQ
jgi:hypothetical protein